MQQTAMHQMRGGFSDEIKNLRDQVDPLCLHDRVGIGFAEEDVEFADREGLTNLIDKIRELIRQLIQRFRVWKRHQTWDSCCHCRQTQRWKVYLTQCATERRKSDCFRHSRHHPDFVEDQINIDGIIFRFTDTAGLRKTTDEIESIGVKRTMEKMQQASVIIYLVDLDSDTIDSVKQQLKELKDSNASHLLVGNKSDKAQKGLKEFVLKQGGILISAKENNNLDELRQHLKSIHQRARSIRCVITNVRHLESLQQTDVALKRVLDGIHNGTSNDLVAQDIRQALFHLGEITGRLRLMICGEYL